jgi:hypothetical protein
MAYISKEEKQEKTVLLKQLGKKYGVTLTVARNNFDTIVLNISKGKIDFFNDYLWETGFFTDGNRYLNVNHYYLNDQFKINSLSLEFLTKAFEILNKGNYNNSDSMTDYFDIGFYVDINIGKFQKPYIFIGG